MNRRRALSRPLRAVLLVWVAGFLVGTVTHTIDLIAGGLEAYAGFHPGVRVFWASLTLLDPITALLLALRRRTGVALGVLVMVADVTVNWTVAAMVPGLGIFGLINQSAFAVFVFATAAPLWRGIQPRPALDAQHGAS